MSARKQRVYFTPKDDLDIYQLWHAGDSVSEISAAINHPRGSVEKRVIVLRGRGVDLPYRRPYTVARPYWMSRPVVLAPVNDYRGPKFCDDPRALGDHGSSRATLLRPVTSSGVGCSAAWAAQG
jgi:hypothetical protein